MPEPVVAKGELATLDVQVALEAAGLPSPERMLAWVEAALETEHRGTELVIRLVDEAESAELNETFRGKAGPTNVLSFPFDMPPEVEGLQLLGDLVICAPVVRREALEQGKVELAHWAHMVVHGTLHLQGYDHQDEAGAAEMEGLERQILARLGYPDPYHEETDHTRR
jgi:probable rRNA maturation factor